MFSITIHRSIIPPDTFHRYLEDSQGRLCIIGQVLTQLGHNCEGKHRIPSDLGKEIPPFTIKIRNRIIDTNLTIELLKLDIYPLPERLERAVQLLSSHFEVTVRL